MKRNAFPIKQMVVFSVLLFGGFGAGLLFQRFYGFGNLIPISALVEEDAALDIGDSEVHVFLLAGQSNMEGTGDIDSYTAPPDSLQRRIFQFTRQYDLAMAREPIAAAGVGPGVAFAARYLELVGDPSVSVVLVPAARGGTNLK